MEQLEKNGLQWCRGQRAQILEDLKPFEDGTKYIKSKDGSGLKDTTGEWILMLKGRLAEMERLIAVYEARDAALP